MKLSVGEENTQVAPPTRNRGAGHRPPVGSLSARIVAYCVVCVVVVAPFLIGGGPAWAQMVSTAIVLIVALIFAVSRRFTARSVPFVLPMVLGVLMTAVQIVPLPAPIVGLLSARALDLRTETMAAPPTFVPLTLDVPATTIELAKGMACLTLLIVVAATVRRGSNRRVVIFSLAFIGSAIAAVHIVQRSLGIESILGLYPIRDPPGSGPLGTFVNANQGSSVVTLSALVAAGVALETRGAMRVAATISVLLSTALVLFATSSRSGLVGLAVGGALFTALTLSRRYGARRGITLTLGLAATLGATGLWASPVWRTRLYATSAMSDQKIRGWRDALDVVGAHPLTGVGRGAFEAPASAFRHDGEGVRLVFPENLVLQLASEWGLPFTVVLVALVAAGGIKLARYAPRLEPSQQAAACGVVAVVAHEIGDFALELPGVAFPAVVALGVAVAKTRDVPDPSRSDAWRFGVTWTTAGLVAFTGALAGGLWALPRTLEVDGRRAREAVEKKSPTAHSQIVAAIRRHPADYYLELLAGIDAIERKDGGAGRHLNRAQRLHPAEPRAHLVTARWLASTGRRSQAALEYRMAHERGASASHAEIVKAVGVGHLPDAVPQTGTDLMNVGTFLLRQGHLGEAREVSRHAVDVSGSEGLNRERVVLALESRSPGFIEEAAQSLLSVASEPTAYVAAAEALSKAGSPVASDEAVDKGMAAHPSSSLLVLTGARLRLDRHDVAGAAAILRRGGAAQFSFSDRIQIAEISAEIAEQRGDRATAAVFRARARSLSRSSGANGREGQ